MDELNEQLSAMVDDELKPAESRLLLRQVARLPGALDRLGRYLLIRATMHGNLAHWRHDDLAARVALALEAEPAFSSARSRRGPLASFTKPAAGLAIAAAVALVAVTLWPRLEMTGPGAVPGPGSAPMTVASVDGSPFVSPVAVGADPAVPASATAPQQPAPRQWELLDPRVREQLNTYLVDHNEYSADSRFDGAITYVRVAAQEGE